ncbi:hypothetical protein BpHYR1_039100, partial [Brachionus plicatilis]
NRKYNIIIIKGKNIFLFLDVLRNLRFLRTKNILNVGEIIMESFLINPNKLHDYIASQNIN